MSSIRRVSIDEDQEFRLSLDKPSEPNNFLARSSWNAGLAKDLHKSRLSLGLPRTDRRATGSLAAIPPTRTEGRGPAVEPPWMWVLWVRTKFWRPWRVPYTRRPPGVPQEPLKLLRLMVDLISGLTRQLREEVFRHSSAQHQVGSPTTWVDTLGALAPRGSMPAGGLALLKDTLVPAGGGPSS